MAHASRYRAHGLVYAISFVVFVVVATVAILLTRGYTIDLPHHSITKTGLLVLNATPTNGAYVTINGALNSERTRAHIKLSPGDYTVKVDKPGVIPWEKHFRLEPGKAVLEEDIALFSLKPNRHELTDAPALGLAISQNTRQVAMVTAVPEGVAVSVADLNENGTARKLTALPATFASPQSFSFSDDGNRLAISSATETAVLPLTGNGHVTLPLGGRVRFAPGQNDTVLVEQPGQVSRLRATEPTQPPELLEDRISSWTISAEAAYFAKTDGTVIRRDFHKDNRRELKADRPLVELSAAPNGDVVFARDAAQTLSVIQGEKLIKVAENVSTYAVSRDGSAVAYLGQRELHIWERATGTDKLVTRFTDPPETITTLPGAHAVLYLKQGSLHAIAADGSNDNVLSEAVGPQLSVTGPFSALTVNTANGRPMLLKLAD